MDEYHKIQTVFKRDPSTKYKTLLDGDFSLPEFAYLAKNIWVCTEKVDGTNIRVMYKEGNITFGGRTDRAQIPAQLIERLTDTFMTQVDGFNEIFNTTDVCLYGEGYGPKIQKGGGNYREDQDFVLFDIKVGDVWLRRADVVDIAGKLGIDVVPIVDVCDLHEMVRKVKAGVTSTWGDFQAEGYVARPVEELMTRDGKRIITKIKCKDFA